MAKSFISTLRQAGQGLKLEECGSGSGTHAGNGVRADRLLPNH